MRHFILKISQKHINRAGFDDEEALAPTVHNELIKTAALFWLAGDCMAYRKMDINRAPRVRSSQTFLRSMVRLGHGCRGSREQAAILQAEHGFDHLQNKNFFERLPDGKYRIRES